MTNPYDLTSAAYCSQETREYCRRQSHVSLTDHNPGRAVKIEFAPAKAVCHQACTATEHSNSRVKDELAATASSSAVPSG